TLQAGFTPGGGVYNGQGSTLTMTRCTVSGNKDNSNVGGGVLNNRGSTATLTSCTIADNTAVASGGGLFNGNLGDGRHANTLSLLDCDVRGNSAEAGGGISNASVLTVATSKIQNNTAKTKGGGISTTRNIVKLTDTVVSNNKVVNTAGAARGG